MQVVPRVDLHVARLLALHIDDVNDATGKKKRNKKKKTTVILLDLNLQYFLFKVDLDLTTYIFFELLTQMKRIHTLLLTFFLFAQTKSSRNFRMSEKLHKLLLT